MALVLADRVRDTTTTTGTGTVTLSGTAPTGYQTFGNGVGNGNTTYYTINAGSQWEVGLGTYSSTGPTLARTTVIASSNSGSAVDFAVGTKDVFVTYPAEKSVYQDGSAIKAGSASLAVTNGGTGATSLTSGYLVKGNGTSAASASVVYDNGTNVGIGTTSPGYLLTVAGSNLALRLAASAPSMAFSSADQATSLGSIRHNATDLSITNVLSGALTLSTANTERMRIDSSGNVGIGTTNPSAYGKFATVGAAAGGAVQIGVVNTDNTGFAGLSLYDNSGVRSQIWAGGSSYSSFGGAGSLNYSANSGPHVWYTNYAERMRITSAGKVGIGTTGPNEVLQVSGTIGSIAGSGSNGFVVGDYGATAGTFTITAITGRNLAFNDSYAGAERMRIDSSGNLLVGTTAATGKLVCAGTFSVLDSSSAGYQLSVSASNGVSTISAYQSGNQALAFNTASSGASNEAMRITSSGNLGLGTSSPSYRLEVVSGDTTAGIGYAMRIRSNATAAAGAIQFTDSPVTTQNGLIACTNSGILTLQGGDGGSSAIAFRATGNERARIDANGYLLVGKTAANNTSLGVTIYKNGTASGRIEIVNGTAGGTAMQAFYYSDGTGIGSISGTSTTTSYNTSSDYRLKDIAGPITTSGAYIDALNPVQGSWKADGSRFIGLIAHEAQEVSETQIATGEKDGEVMQAMDYSSPEIIANLIAEIQSLRARVAQLEGK